MSEMNQFAIQHTRSSLILKIDDDVSLPKCLIELNDKHEELLEKCRDDLDLDDEPKLEDLIDTTKFDVHSTMNYSAAGFIIESFIAIDKFIKTVAFDDLEEAKNHVIQDFIHETTLNQQNGSNSVLNKIRLSKDLDALKIHGCLLHKSWCDKNMHHPLLFDASGASLVHQVYGLEKYELGRLLVQQYPDFAILPHTSKTYFTIKGQPLAESAMPFTGQNILHMTILRRNLTEAKWLLDFYRQKSPDDIRKIVMARATGAFFRNKFYYGETPLHFAVCMNDFDMVDLLLSYLACVFHPKYRRMGIQSYLFSPDRKGNNVVHLCVYHNLPRMYNHIQRKAKLIIEQELRMAYHSNSHEEEHDIYQPLIAIPSTMLAEEDGHSEDKFEGYLRIPRHIHLTFALSVKQEAARKIDLWINAEDDKTVDEEITKFFNLLLNRSVKSRQHSKRGFKDMTALEKKTIHDSGLEKLMMLWINVYNPREQTIEENNVKNQFRQWLLGWRQSHANDINDWLFGRDGVYESGAIQQVYEDRLLLCLNGERHTPLTYAASKGNKEIFQALFSEATFPRWKYGPIQSYIFDMEGVEFPLEVVSSDGEDLFIPSARTLQLPSCLTVICTSNLKVRSTMFGIIELGAIVDRKWERFGSPIIFRQATVSFFIAILFTILACTAIRGDFHEYNSSAYIIPVVFVCYASVASFEISQAVKHSHLYVVSCYGIALYDKLLKLVSALMFIILFVSRFVETSIPSPHQTTATSRTYLCALSVLCFISWMQMFLYVSVTERFGPFIVKVCEIVRRDMVYFTEFYIIVLLAFGLAITLLTLPTDDFNSDPGSGFVRFFRVCYALADLTFGSGADNDNILDVSQIDHFVKPFFELLMFCYGVTVDTLLLNLLIAMMSDTYNDYAEYARIQLQSMRYNFMNGLQIQLGDESLKELRNKYSLIVEPMDNDDEDNEETLNKHIVVQDLLEFSEDKDHSDEHAIEYAIHKHKVEKHTRKVPKRQACVYRMLDLKRWFFEMLVHDEKLEDTALTDAFEDLDVTDVTEEILSNKFSDRHDAGEREVLRIPQPSFWVNRKGDHANPSQVITLYDVITNTWRPINNDMLAYAKYHLSQLEKRGQELVIQQHKRRVLVLVCPQNDFHDRVPERGIKRERIRPLDKELVATSLLSPGIRVSVINEFSEDWSSSYTGEIILVSFESNEVTYTVLFDVVQSSSVFQGKYMSGSLPVIGAFEDSLRVAELITKCWYAFDEIFIVMDTHFEDHISHRWFWRKDKARDLTESFGLNNPSVDMKIATEEKKIAELMKDVDKADDDEVFKAVVKSTTVVMKAARIFTDKLKSRKARLLKSPVELATEAYKNVVTIAVKAHSIADNVNFSEYCTAAPDQKARCRALALEADDFVAKIKAAISMAKACGDNHEEAMAIVATAEKDVVEAENRLNAIIALENEIVDAGGIIHPIPYTVITNEDIRLKKWVPMRKELFNYALYYTHELERKKRFLHTIWPEHCLIGSPSHNEFRKDESIIYNSKYETVGYQIVETIRDALEVWKSKWQSVESFKKDYQFINTGTNLLTEIYSALGAEVTDLRDPRTNINETILKELRTANQMYICGQALSHCVKYTVQDFFNFWTGNAADMVLLRDGNHYVPEANQFVDDMKAKGMTILNCEEAFVRLCDPSRQKDLAEWSPYQLNDGTRNLSLERIPTSGCPYYALGIALSQVED